MLLINFIMIIVLPTATLPNSRIFLHGDKVGLAILTRPAKLTRTRHEYIGFGFRL
jgi:hypothetical protein